MASRVDEGDDALMAVLQGPVDAGHLGLHSITSAMGDSRFASLDHVGPSSRRRLASSTSPDPTAMEEDDEFGDLYTDILIPTHTPQSTSALSNPVLVETLHRPPPHPNPTPVAAAVEEVNDDWLLGGSESIPGVDPTDDWADEDDDGGEPAPPAKRSTSADDIDPLTGVVRGFRASQPWALVIIGRWCGRER